MSFQTTPDVPLLITVPSTTKDDSTPQLSAERRISPSWTVSQLKAKLEPITGIPPGSQDLRIRGLDGSWIAIVGEERRIGEWALRRGGEMEIHDTRPPSSSSFNPLNPLTSGTVEKYRMPASQYESLTDSVLHWKKTQRLGRFDPAASEKAAERLARDEAEIGRRRIRVGDRCRVGGEDVRRGVVAFVGAVEGLGGGRKKKQQEDGGGAGGVWVGVRFDEPVGRNDGAVMVRVGGGGGDGDDGEGKEVTKRLFECKPGFGVVLRPEKVEVGEEWGELDDLGVGDDEGERGMEEL